VEVVLLLVFLEVVGVLQMGNKMELQTLAAVEDSGMVLVVLVAQA
jgi:hypothetical protein